MDFAKIGKAMFALGPAYMEPSVAKALPDMEKQFKQQRQLIYFWDCESKTGVPNPRKKSFAVRTKVGIQMFDPATGKLDQNKTRMTRLLYGRAILGKKKGDVSALVNKAIPPVKVPIPYSMLDPYRDAYHIKMYVTFKPMFYLAHLMGKGPAPAGKIEDYMWLVMARDFEFEIKLISRCDGKTFDMGKDWDGTRTGDPIVSEMEKLRFEADKYGREEAQKAKNKAKKAEEGEKGPTDEKK